MRERPRKKQHESEGQKKQTWALLRQWEIAEASIELA